MAYVQVGQESTYYVYYSIMYHGVYVCVYVCIYIIYNIYMCAVAI